MTTSEPTTEIINHVCKECGFVGGATAINGKVKCPSCGTVNDVWLLGEAPPPNHREEPTTGEIVRALGNPETLDQESLYYWSKVAADRLESQEQAIEELKSEAIVNALENAERIANLTARAEQAELERDAAVVDMKSIVDAVREEYIDGTCCFACKYDFDTSCDEYGCCPWECPGFESNDCFEWRGLPQEGEGK